MELKETFQKQGGMKLIKQYAKNGSLETAIGEFLLLGKSRTALEILRLSTQMKVKQRLEKKYRRVLNEFDKTYNSSLPHESSNKVWICWFQGIENAPDIVQMCYKSVNEYLTDREIVLITDNNMADYVQFPVYIQNKIDKGIIKGAHLSDLLRLELLLKFGGTWIDSTVYCSGSNVPDYMLNSDLFLFQNLKPGRDGHCTVISNWFITSKSNNKLLAATKFLLYKYWKDNDELMDYFIFHIFFQIVIEKYSEEWNKVIPFSNSIPHILQLRQFDQYDEKTWNAIKMQTPFHKLSYKVTDEEMKREGTYYNRLISHQEN